MLLVTTTRFEPRSTGVRAIVTGLQVRAAETWAPWLTVGAVARTCKPATMPRTPVDRGSNRGVVTSSIVARGLWNSEGVRLWLAFASESTWGRLNLTRKLDTSNYTNK